MAKKKKTKFSIQDRLEKMQEQGLLIITPEGVDKAIKGGWVEEKSRDALSAKAEQAIDKAVEKRQTR